MPKATLTFNLPEEDQEHQDAVDGTLWRIVVVELLDHLREKRKYENKKSMNIDDLREFILEEMDTRRLKID